MWFAATYGPPKTRRRLERARLDARRRDPLPARLPGSKVPWEFQPQRPDLDHFNRDYKPETGARRHGDLPARSRVTAG